METFEEKLAALDRPAHRRGVGRLSSAWRRTLFARLDQAAASPGVPHRQFLEV